MCTSDSQIEKWLEELSLNGSEIEDNLEKDFDSDDSLIDPNFQIESEDEVENIIVGNQELTPVAVSPIDVPQSNDQPNDSLIIKPSEAIVRGKNNFIWSTEPSSTKRSSSRTPARNIIHILPGSKREFRDVTKPLDCFEKLFIPLEEILLYTNEDIKVKSNNYKKQTTTTSLTKTEELRALLGILVLSGALKNNHLSTKELFDPLLCGSKNVGTFQISYKLPSF